MNTRNDKHIWDSEHLLAFRSRVAEATQVARAAASNFVAALASATFALVGAALTIGTTEFKPTPIGYVALSALLGAGAAAFALLIALAVEAIRADSLARSWQRLLEAAINGEIAQEEAWSRVKKARISVAIWLKIWLPGILLATGILIGVVLWFTEVPEHQTDRRPPTAATQDKQTKGDDDGDR